MADGENGGTSRTVIRLTYRDEPLRIEIRDPNSTGDVQPDQDGEAISMLAVDVT